MVAGLAEALEDGGVLLLWSKAYGAPLCLKFQNLLGEGVPFYLLALGLGLAQQCFCLLAQSGLLLQILCLACLDALEVSLMALVYLGGGVLETCPQFFAQVTLHGPCLLPLLVQGLQLSEGTDDVLHGKQCFCLLAQVGLYLQVLAEVIVAHLVAQLQQVVELLSVELVVLPNLRALFCRDGTDFLPCLLQLLELVEVCAHLFGSGGQLLYLLQDGGLALEVLCALFLKAQLLCGTTFADGLHGLAEGLFLRIHYGNIGCGVAALFDVLLACLLERLVVITVEELLKLFHIGLFGDEFCLCQFLCTSHNLFFSVELYVFYIFHNSILNVER